MPDLDLILSLTPLVLFWALVLLISGLLSPKATKNKGNNDND